MGWGPETGHGRKAVPRLLSKGGASGGRTSECDATEPEHDLASAGRHA